MRQRIASSSGAASARSARPIASPEHTAEAAGESTRKIVLRGPALRFLSPPARGSGHLQRVIFKERFVGFPEVTEALFSSIFRWDFCPKPSAGPCAPVPDHEGYDLPSSSAQSDPEPPLVRALTDGADGRTSSIRPVRGHRLFKDIAFSRTSPFQGHRLPQAVRPDQLPARLCVLFLSLF